MEFYIVNAFTDETFGGNTAGVVLYDSLSEEFMQKLATEIRFSETAFVKILSADRFNIRYFTPVSEVNLCGHATLAALAALKDVKLIKPECSYTIETKAGILKVISGHEDYFLEQAKPIEGCYIRNLTELSSILGLTPAEIGDENFPLLPQIISTGLPDILLPVRNSATLSKIRPDMAKLTEYSRSLGVVGVHAFTLDSKEYTALCRNFAPLYGINEEAATGTSNGALTYYLYKNSVLGNTDSQYAYLQGVSMNRPSVVLSRITDSDGRMNIWVGGKCNILSKGKINI